MLDLSFSTGVRFEIFFSLQLLCDASASVHAGWKDRVLARCPADFLQRMERLRLSPALWTALADAPGTLPVDTPCEELIQTLETCPLELLQRRTLYHFIHDSSRVQAVCSQDISLAEAIRLGARSEGEWLSFVGLYPYSESASMVQTLESLIRDPAAVFEASLQILREYWDRVFRETWAGLSLPLRAKMEEKHRLLESSDFETFARNALIPIEMDDRRQTMRAVRTGHEHPYGVIDSMVFCPSVFNYKRLRAVIETPGDRLSFYFPFFLPEIAPSQGPEATSPPTGPYYHLDAALIFKALGDTTRYAIASIIAREPTSSVVLARKLSLTRATVSHHVRILREAGLLDEKRSAGSVLLTLRRSVIDQIPRLARRQLFE